MLFLLKNKVCQSTWYRQWEKLKMTAVHEKRSFYVDLFLNPLLPSIELSVLLLQ
jgi:hypothetical protein